MLDRAIHRLQPMVRPRPVESFQMFQDAFVLCLVYRCIVKMQHGLSLMCLPTVGVTELRQKINNTSNEIHTVHFLTRRQKVN
jgi:hypothetical protein